MAEKLHQIDLGGPEDPQAATAKAKEITKRYLTRFDHVKKGKDAYANGKWTIAIKSYREYLKIMTETKNVSIKQFSPKNFDHKIELAEMLVISHIFWDLTILYDRSPGLEQEFESCLNLYLSFTIGFKYHNANLASFRRYISIKDVRNKTDFNKAYNTLLSSSKKCFIATLCFGSDDVITNDYRVFKKWLLKYRLGLKFVDNYYHYSPKLIALIEHRPVYRFVFVEGIAKPFLRIGHYLRTFGRK